MWSFWLVFCDCGFHSVALWQIRIRGLWKFPNGRDWLRGKLVLFLFWWVGPCSVNLKSNILLMGGAVFPPYCLTWGQTMVEVMKIMVTSFKRSHAGTAALSASDPAAGHCWPMPPPETPDTHEQVWVSLLWGHCSFLLSPGVHKVLFVPSKSLFPQSCVSSGGSLVG